jgi:flagellar hook assembly protein FlgD
MALAQNYPNPFNPTTMITFTVPGAAGEKKHAAVEIFDTRGKRVRTLFEGELEPGTHAMSWNGRTSSGESTGSGIYLYRLSVDGESVSRKMVLLK